MLRKPLLLVGLSLASATLLAQTATGPRFFIKKPAPFACPTGGCPTSAPSDAKLNPPNAQNPGGGTGGTGTGGTGGTGGSGEPTAPAGAAVLLSPNSLTFPLQAQGTTSAAQVVTLSNTGGQTLNISDVQVSQGAADFSQTSTCVGALPAGNSCSIRVTFHPTAGSTSRTGKITLTHDGSGPTSLDLSGTMGVNHAILRAQTGTNYGTVYLGQSATKYFFFENDGNVAVNNIQAAVSGSQYSITFNNCGTAASPGTLLPLQGCTVTVTYTPNAKATHNGTLTLGSSAANGPSSLTLSGQGENDPRFVVGGKTYIFASPVQQYRDAAYALCSGTLGGETGWRTPSFTELQALGDYIMANGGSALFASKGWPSSGATSSYWTNTVHNTNYMKAVDLPTSGAFYKHNTLEVAFASCVK